MSTESDTATAFGISSQRGWPIGGALGGAIGAAAFGLLMWLFDPEVLTAAIPRSTGSNPWVSSAGDPHPPRDRPGDRLRFPRHAGTDPGCGDDEPETDVLSQTSIRLRIVAAGFVFGLAIWAILPLIVLPVWLETIGTAAGVSSRDRRREPTRPPAVRYGPGDRLRDLDRPERSISGRSVLGVRRHARASSFESGGGAEVFTDPLLPYFAYTPNVVSTPSAVSRSRNQHLFVNPGIRRVRP